MNFAEIWPTIWLVMEAITGLPIGVYNILSRTIGTFAGFAFLSNDHVWWHNVILLIIWAGLYIGVCSQVWSLITRQIFNQFEAVREKHGISIYTIWSILLYILGIVFPFVTQMKWVTYEPWSAWLAYEPWAPWLGLIFPAIAWVYYFIRTGVGFFNVLLRQLYVAFLACFLISFMILPIIVACIMFLFGFNLFSYSGD